MQIQLHHSKVNNFRILQHWIWIVSILMVVWLLAIRQIDLYAPTSDEFYSSYNAGGIINSPYAPIEILTAINKNSPQHTLGYYLLLGVWGNTISWDIVITRILTIYAGLISIAIMVRLAKDTIHPIAGLYVAVILASNAFYAFFYAHNRMYPFVLSASALTLWLYIRILYQLHHPRLRHYMALACSVFVLINVHIFSVMFLGMLGIYHLLFVSKTRRWLYVSIAVCVAVLLFLPYVVVIITGIPEVVSRHNTNSIDAIQTIELFLILPFNNSPLLVLITFAGLIIGVQRSDFFRLYHVVMGILFVLVIAVVAQFSILITQSGMRYLLVGWSAILLLITSAFVALYLWRRWTIVLLVFWIIAGIVFNGTSEEWSQYLAGRLRTLDLPAIHAVSRLAQDSPIAPYLIFRDYLNQFEFSRNLDITQLEYYLLRHSAGSSYVFQAGDLINEIEAHINHQPTIWVVYQTSDYSPYEAGLITERMQKFYQLCDSVHLGLDTVVERYKWNNLDCELPVDSTVEFINDDIRYELHQVDVDIDESRIRIIDQWSLISDEASLREQNQSYQLLTSDWEKVAQLDIFLTLPNTPRQFYLDIEDVPSGTYRLISVIYDSETGDRLAWMVDGQDVEDMMTLAEVTLP